MIWDDRKFRKPLRRKTPIKSNRELKRVPISPKPPKRSKRPKFEIPEHVATAVRRRSGWECERAGCFSKASHLHHRLMRSQGGAHTVENLLHVCPPCHRYIHDHPEESYEKGWLIRRAS